MNTVALITGTRKGIGKHLVEHLINDLNIEVIGCSRQQPDWNKKYYTHFCMDVSNENDVKNLMSFIWKKYKRLDVLINNAGIASMNLTMLTPFDTMQKIINTNLLGTMLVSREAAKLMVHNKYGRIINFGSVAGPMHIGGETTYGVSKDAISSFTKMFAYEVGSLGITCNCIAPTPIETDLIRGIPKDKLNELINSLAIKRLGTFEDIDNVVDFFINPNSNYITGQTIYLGGI